MSTSSLNNSFTVSSVDFKLETDIRFNIIKRKELVLYRTSSTPDTINLSYLIGKKVRSDKNLFISDKSTFLPENRVIEDTDFRIFKSKTTTINTDRFLITDIFANNTSSGNNADAPLFFKHLLINFDVSDTDTELLKIKVLDKNFNPTAPQDIKLDLTNGIVYNNLNTKYDFASGDHVVFFVRYTVKDNTTGELKSYTELLNNISVYQLASFDDIDEDGNFIEGRKVYGINDLGTNEFEVIVPTIGKYAIKQQSDARITVIDPPPSPATAPWFVSIQNSKFFATIPTSPTETSIIKYDVPEFGSQVFNPFSPYKKRIKEEGIRITQHLIRSLKTKVILDLTQNLHITVVLRNKDLTPRKVITSDLSLVNDNFEDSGIFYTTGVRSVDSSSGIIDITHTIKSNDIIELTYFFKETEVEYLDIDFNPVTNRATLSQRIVFYIVPNTSNSRGRTVFHLTVDKNGKILSTNQTDNTDLLSDIDTNNFFYDAEPNGTPSLNFIDKYTIQASSANKFANPDNPRYFILGEAKSRQSSTPSSLTKIDVRKEGGGLKPDKIPSLVKKYPQVLWTTDTAQWEGQSYPGRANILVEVPIELQNFNGGQFNDVNIRDVVERHTAFGTYPIIRGYSTKFPLNLSADPQETKIKLSWRSFGPSTAYNVYYSLSENGEATKANTKIIGDNPSGNIFTIIGLTGGTRYYIYVAPTNLDTGVDQIPTYIGPSTDDNVPRIQKLIVETLPVTVDTESTLGVQFAVI